jgi:hypothetical protein
VLSGTSWLQAVALSRRFDALHRFGNAVATGVANQAGFTAGQRRPGKRGHDDRHATRHPEPKRWMGGVVLLDPDCGFLRICFHPIQASGRMCQAQEETCDSM